MYRTNKINYIISYGYDKIISKDVISEYKDSIINLHISYLPYNRGSHPNLWSHLENTPIGVAIHRIDEGIDTGPILLRKKIYIEIEKRAKNYTILLPSLNNIIDS